MARSCQPDEQHTRPESLDACDRGDRNNGQGADQHGGLARSVHAPPTLDETHWYPPAHNAANIAHHIDGDQGRAELRNAHAVFTIQIFRQPEQEEPPDGIGQELADDEGPGLAERDQLQPWDLDLFLDGITLDISQFVSCDRRMLFRLAIVLPPQHRPNCAEYAGENEGPSPSPIV